jgi:hypothetical protein
VIFVKENIKEGKATLRYYKRNQSTPNLELKKRNAYNFGEHVAHVERLFKEEGATKRVVNRASSLINYWAPIYGRAWE